MRVDLTKVSRWCPNCQDWFGIDEPCDCESHEPSSRSRKKERSLENKNVIPKKRRPRK